ncbi:MAG: hypothetical protein R3B40_25370 [Polyangiales bacterium]
MSSSQRATVGDLARTLEQRVYVERPSAQRLFEQLLSSEDGRPSVLYLSAPGGSGKSVCLRLFEAYAEQHGMLTCFLDARDVPADARAAELAILQAVSLVAGSHRGVVFVDTFEAHQALERVYRERILPKTPRSVRVVLAGRMSPDGAWARDPVWSQLMLTHRLPLLSHEEARALLSARFVPEVEHDELIALARGHALTLACLATEGYERGQPFRAGSSQLAELGDPLELDEKLAILTLCLGHWMPESDLVRVAGTGSFLPQLERHAFVERVGTRWRIHELYRDGFLARLRGELVDELPGVVRRAIWNVVARSRDETDFDKRVQLQFEVGFLLRALPPGEGLLERFEMEAYYRDGLRDDDVPLIVAAVERFEGSASAALALAHLARFPDLCTVLRDPTGAPVGVTIWMDGSRLEERDALRDPAAAKLRALPGGEQSHMVRWWFTLDQYQAPSAAFSHLTVHATSVGQARLRTPVHGHFVHTLTPASGATWCELGLLDRIPELEFELDGNAYAVVGYDFRSETQHERMVRDIERMLDISASMMGPPPASEASGTHRAMPSGAPPRHTTAPPPADRASVTDAVTEALRWYRYDDRLSQSQLASGMPGDSPLERAARVRALLDEAHRRLRPTGRSPEPATLIARSYFEREDKQLAIAHDLGLAHGTYRRRLREAVKQLTVCVESVWAEQGH